MSGRPKIEIKESAEELSKMLKTQKRSLEYNKVLTLYLFVTKQVLTIRKAARILNKGTATINRWLRQYKEGGIENLLKNRQTIGRPKKFSVETVAKIQQELKSDQGFNSYQEIRLWLMLVLEIFASYATVYKVVKKELKGKLKVARPQHISQKNGAISKFKNTLSEQIKTLRYKALNQFKDKYKKVSFW